MDSPSASSAAPNATDRPVNRAPATKPPAEAGVKDTIESILVAFILAFIFRAFIVEAFVIPTGSMAPTLLGAHMRFRCPDCGYRFDVNYQGRETAGDDVLIPSSAGKQTYFAIFCPNCGYRLPRESIDDPNNDAHDATVRYGDRILVLKYLYLFQEPTRWDVVVFKSPYDAARYDYAQNYIKRLVGKPGESIMVLDGDVYVGKGVDLASFRVQTKPRSVQEALWRIVDDHDYRPRGQDRQNLVNRNGQPFSDPPWREPWKQETGQTGWKLDDVPGRDVVFDNASGQAALAFDATANPRKHSLTDWLAYDVTDGQQGRDSDPDTYAMEEYAGPANTFNVSDLKLEFVYERRGGGDGSLMAELSKLGDTFTFVLGANSVSLQRNGKLIAGPAPIDTSKPLHVELTNVDYRASVTIDGKEILATTPEQYHPDVSELLTAFSHNKKSPRATVRLIGDRQTCTLSHLALWRDVYYLNQKKGGEPLDWASPHNFPSRIAQLGPDEFFVLGDNSYVSADARYWTDPIRLPQEGLNVEAGRVPRRFMLGKAFFVYWPAGYRPVESAPALVPDFADMRFIR